MTLRNNNCKDDNLASRQVLQQSDASLPHPFTNHDTGTDGAVRIHVAEQSAARVAQLRHDNLVISIGQWFHCQTCATWHQL